MAYRYSPAARGFHWITVGLVLVMATFGVWMTYFEPKDAAFKFLLYDIHQSIGAVLFVLVLLRLLRRMAVPPAPLPLRQSRFVRFAARTNHALLYAMLLIQPVLGFLNINAAGFPLHWARLVEIPSPLGRNEAIAPILSALHWYGAALLLILIAVHLCGVFYHGAIRRDGVVRRML